MSRRTSLAFLLPAVAAVVLLAACDGEKIDYSDATRYDLTWIWKAGDSANDVTGNYGSLGVEASTNHPGARHGAVSWRDATGHFWLFGGEGRDGNGDFGELNDLWMYNGTNWTWEGGAATRNADGVYGTLNTPDVLNVPGARTDAVSWRDADGNLWLFGGLGYDDAGGTLGRLNDLWKYDGTYWTWIGGANAINANGVYGSKGVADALNWPGGRYQASGWIDTANNLWLFAGHGLRSTGTTTGRLNDLWKRDHTTGQWTWVTGEDAFDGAATYGTRLTPDPANTPGSRMGGVAWFDSSGNAWIYGGESWNGTSRVATNELWQFSAAGQWSWVSGTQGAFVAPSYEARGVVTLTGTPGSRTRPTAWVTPSGTASTLWLFGGDIEATSGVVTHQNDLWRYDTGYWTWVGGKNYDNLPGEYNGLGLAGQPGGRASGSSWIDTTSRTLWLYGGDDHDDLWFYVY